MNDTHIIVSTTTFTATPHNVVVDALLRDPLGGDSLGHFLTLAIPTSEVDVVQLLPQGLELAFGEVLGNLDDFTHRWPRAVGFGVPFRRTLQFGGHGNHFDLSDLGGASGP